MDPRYEAILERAHAVAANDPRIVRVEVHGSVATGTDDAWSDLDLKLIVRDEDHQAVVDNWREWLDAITPTVFADTPIAPFVVNSVTTDGLTFDLSIWPESLPDFPPPTGLQVGFLSGRRYDNYPDAVAYAVSESLRGMAGPLIKFLKRGQHIAHFMGTGHSISLLLAVLLAEQDAPIDGRRPADALSVAQRFVVTNLPSVQPDFHSLLTFELAVAKEIVTRSRKLLAAYGREWPTEFERVAAQNLRAHLGVTTDFLAV